MSVTCAVETTKPACSIRHTFQFQRCGKPAAFEIVGTPSHVCEDCLPLFSHMPREIFVPVRGRS
jgi:hypothetical protein